MLDRVRVERGRKSGEDLAHRIADRVRRFAALIVAFAAAVIVVVPRKYVDLFSVFEILANDLSEGAVAFELSAGGIDIAKRDAQVGLLLKALSLKRLSRRTYPLREEARRKG